MRLFLLCLLLLAMWSDRAEACSCRAPGPPCESMFHSTVFVGTVTAVSTEPRGVARTTFAVTDVLHSKRPLGKTVDVHHSAIGSMCGLTFEKGKTYVVYASGDDELSTGACTLTHLWRKGDEDVAFAHSKPTRTEALVEGLVLTETGPQPGIEVRVVGTKLAATSDQKGKFKMMLAPGDYALEITTPGYRPWRGESPKVSLPVAAACARVEITLSIDGRIEGRLTDGTGKPVVGLEVFAQARREKDRRWRLSGQTDADGRYVIHEVPPGTFYVGVSLPDFGGPSSSTPYPTTWFPGVADFKTAKTVTLERAGVSSGVDFVLPQGLVVRTVRGTVKLANGAVPTNAFVTLIPQGENRSTGGAIDAKGEFSFDELSGLEVVIRACVLDAK